MSTLEVNIPDLLFKQVNEVAAKEKVSVDQIVSIALAAQVSRVSSAREHLLPRQTWSTFPNPLWNSRN